MFFKILLFWYFKKNIFKTKVLHDSLSYRIISTNALSTRYLRRVFLYWLTTPSISYKTHSHFSNTTFQSLNFRVLLIVSKLHFLKIICWLSGIHFLSPIHPKNGYFKVLFYIWTLYKLFYPKLMELWFNLFKLIQTYYIHYAFFFFSHEVDHEPRYIWDIGSIL
jgi:hypothetical protein